jgi:uncharacterized membrane-anchored protein
MSNTIRLIIAVAIQSVVLTAMIGMKQWTLDTGVSVVLKTTPIDPRSLFRGDYVRLNYAINDLDLTALDSEDDFRAHETVYVVLDKNDPYWLPAAVERDMPALGPNQVAIKGTVRYTHRSRSRNGKTRRMRMRVRYGIENYFVPEGEGRALERPQEGEAITIQVAIDRYGKAGIKAVMVNGEPRYKEKLF